MNSDDVADRLAAVRSRIDAVERAWGHPVEVVAVTKGFGDEAIEAAAAAGCAAIGENYAQELVAKWPTVQRVGVEVHFIGRLQTNKVRQVAGMVDLWASLDRASVLAEVARRAPAAAVLLQVNATGEDAKGGCRPDAVASLLAAAQDLGLRVQGLMTVGPTVGPPESARPAFRRVRELVDEHGLATCSMGMSGDLAVAVEEGSTQVRVGTALFGRRPPRS